MLTTLRYGTEVDTAELQNMLKGWMPNSTDSPPLNLHTHNNDEENELCCCDEDDEETD